MSGDLIGSGSVRAYPVFISGCVAVLAPLCLIILGNMFNLVRYNSLTSTQTLVNVGHLVCYYRESEWSYLVYPKSVQELTKCDIIDEVNLHPSGFWAI